MNIGELFVSLGFDVDDSKLKEFNDGIKTSVGELLKISAVATGAVYALNAFMEGSAQNAVNLKNFTAQTGYSSEALQKWQAVIHETNPAVGLEEAANGYKKLAQTLIDIRQGKGNSGALAMLGVTYDPNMTPEMALEQVRAHLQQTIAQNGIGFTTDKLNAIGIGAGAINALMLSSQRFEAQAANALVSDQNLNRLQDYAREIAELDVEWNKFKMDLTADWAPGLTKFLPQAAEGLHDFYTNVKVVVDYLYSMREQLKIIEVILGGLAAFWAISTFPVTAAFLGLAAAINEVGKAMQGKANFGGKWLDEWKKQFHDLGVEIQNLRDGAPAGTPGNDVDFFHTMQNSAEVNRLVASQSFVNSSPANSVSQTITQNIHTTADSRDTADHAVRLLQEEKDTAYNQLNLGVRY